MATPIRPLSYSLRRQSNGESRRLSTRVTSVTVCSVRYSVLFFLNTTTVRWKRFVPVV
ncbi:gene 19.3 [Escherichia phage T7]|uniref:Gene 19.3 n=1 Tax=Escherichia phage T7 TaxID=10760 RepID=Q6WY10_BPT7|nr:gene 19.3 [Escherichia phage T7]AAP34171.1 gene 19.3 [Escherichia phage T7]